MTPAEEARLHHDHIVARLAEVLVKLEAIDKKLDDRFKEILDSLHAIEMALAIR